MERRTSGRAQNEEKVHAAADDDKVFDQAPSLNGPRAGRLFDLSGIDLGSSDRNTGSFDDRSYLQSSGKEMKLGLKTFDFGSGISSQRLGSQESSLLSGTSGTGLPRLHAAESRAESQKSDEESDEVESLRGVNVEQV